MTPDALPYRMIGKLEDRVTWCEQRDGAIQGRCHDLEDRATHLAKVMVELEGDQVVLEERVARLEALADKQAQFIAVQAERVAQLEKYRVDYVQVCTRVAELEHKLAALTDFTTEMAALLPDYEREPLPWRDLD